MSAAELLGELRRRGVRLAVDGDRLRYSGPEGALTAALLAELARHKPEILAHPHELDEESPLGACIGCGGGSSAWLDYGRPLCVGCTCRDMRDATAHEGATHGGRCAEWRREGVALACLTCREAGARPSRAGRFSTIAIDPPWRYEDK